MTCLSRLSSVARRLPCTAAVLALPHRLPWFPAAAVKIQPSSVARPPSTTSRCLHISPHAYHAATTSPPPAESDALRIIDSWRDKVLAKPTVVEHDTIRPLTMVQLDMTLSKGPVLANPVSSTPVAQLGTPLPVNWHHAFFPPLIGENDLGQDGYEMTHAPPAPFLARMWAGGAVEQNPANLLRVGQAMTMKTRCTAVDVKQSRQGEPMVFVRLEKQVENEHGWALTDTRTLVYMEKDETKKPLTRPKNVKPRRTAEFSMTVLPTIMTLFRYSALTFNTHRIHYDHEYATKVEDHPACIVHGPLTATYLIENLRHRLAPGLVMKNFQYRALSPLYVDQPLTVCARQMDLTPTQFAPDVVGCYEVWATNSDGGLSMSGTVEVAHEQAK
ncbi:hypothetical protein DFQ27_001134 [Actinomortierella ambigua]|uniref:MaoC-like domain-containing protein n=1 Tax=Actinomortierella ambigua TaxID=1343610 RepID=A0A9P6U7Z9_9FUNG|nr:hypothetical protein DFQ27_001134 [Actinomortierella ambigua]